MVNTFVLFQADLEQRKLYIPQLLVLNKPPILRNNFSERKTVKRFEVLGRFPGLKKQKGAGSIIRNFTRVKKESILISLKRFRNSFEI